MSTETEERRKYAMEHLDWGKYLLVSNGETMVLLICKQVDEQHHWYWEVFAMPVATFRRILAKAEKGPVATCKTTGRSLIVEVDRFLSRRGDCPWTSQGAWPTRRAALEGVARLVEN